MKNTTVARQKPPNPKPMCLYYRGGSSPTTRTKETTKATDRTSLGNRLPSLHKNKDANKHTPSAVSAALFETPRKTTESIVINQKQPAPEPKPSYLKVDRKSVV